MSGEWPGEDLEAVGACPACAERGRELLHGSLADPVYSSPGRWDSWRCLQCGSAYLDPRPTAESIARAYESYYTHVGPEAPSEPAGALGRARRAVLNGYLNSEYGYRREPATSMGSALLGRLPQTSLRIDKVIRHLAWEDGGRVLDVGSGNGEFLVQARELGWEPHGIDPDPRAAEHARAAGLDVATGGVEDVPDDRSYQAITLSHVIEHVHDPRKSVAALRESLAPGGMLWLATPNIESVGHRVFGRHWYGLDPPRHLCVFSRRGLGAMLREAGFQRVKALGAPADARWLFGPSERIAAGFKPEGMPPPSSPKVKLRAALATAEARHRADRSEELMFAAWRAGP
jgi:SAM-dependent methyltransferase